MSKILAVVRASTERQETESQKKELLQYITNTLHYAPEDIEVIEVAGASAVKLNAKYVKMWDDIRTAVESKNIKTIALYDVNRLGRDERMLITMKNYFVDNHIQVHFRNQGVKLLDDNGEITIGGSIVFNVFASMVVNDTKEMFAKMHRGKMRNKEQKKFNGGRSVKYGYKVVDKYIVINPDEAANVRMVFEMYATGKYSFLTLSEELNARGVLFRNIASDCWFITKMIADDSYIGYSTANDKPFDPIIDRELFERCAAIRKGKQLKLSTKETRNVRFALRLLRCGQCGKWYVANDKYYMCYAAHNYRQIRVNHCDAPQIKVDVLDGILWHIVQKYHQNHLMHLNTADVSEWENKRDILMSKVSTKQVEVDALRDKMEALEDDYYTNEKMDKAKFEKRSAILNGKLDSACAEIENWQREISEIDHTIASINTPQNERYAETLLKVENEADKPRIKELVMQYVERITLDYAKINGKKAIEINVYMRDGQTFKLDYSSF